MDDDMFLTAQVAKIVQDGRHKRPSWDDYFMATAMLIASRSNCGRLHVGCVLVSQMEHKNRIISAGYNGFIAGAPHDSRIMDGHEQATVHAEQNAITDAARRGVSIFGAVAYVSHFPCLHCAKLLASSGIREIKYHFDYSNDPLAIELLALWGVKISKL
ncbi:MAG: dCMP deaminase [Puniceicoccales bacterium]|nr:dCMP deaminase [Puniceicoccales bacterium]